MAEYRIYIDDHEVRAYAVEYDDVVDVPDHMCSDFVDFIDREQPTRAEIDEWLAKAERLGELEAAFEQAGGRGIDLADEIDRLRREMYLDDDA